jgi:predicted transcriptional regulator
VDEFIKNLELIGLRKREIKILTTLHVFGTLSVTKLAGRAKLPRTTTEAILRRLNERGYVRKVPHGKRHLWKATNVTKIKNRTDAAFDAIQSQVDPSFIGPVLESISAQDIGIQVFRGKKQVQAAYRELVPHGGTVYSIQGAGFVEECIRSVFDQNAQSDFHRLLIERNVIIESVVPDTAINAYFAAEMDPSFWEQAFSVASRMHTVPSRYLAFACELAVFEDRAMITYPKEQLVTVIRYKPYIALFRAYFDLLTSLATPIDTYELKQQLLEKKRE